MFDLCEHDTFGDICNICHRDSIITKQQTEIAKLREEVKKAANDWNVLRDKYDILVIENMDLKKRVAHLEKIASDASWTVEKYRNENDDRPTW